MKEWAIAQWFYRRFICPRKGHFWKNWMSLGLPAHPYCIHCSELQPNWEAPTQNYSWKTREEPLGKATLNP